MNEILKAVIPVALMGMASASGLVIASRIFAVREDERFPEVRECLPGANCGACGFPGCDGYAKALCEKEGTPTNLCVPGGDQVSRRLSELLGVEFQDVVEQVAVVHCSGDCSKTSDKVSYQGITSCVAANMLYGGKGSCSYGCLGFGDCAAACPQSAISIKDGVAHVEPTDCIGCGICTRTCPNRLISLVPDVKNVYVGCSNKDKGAATRKICSAGCIGCKKCERSCPLGAITVRDNLAVIDYEKCTDCPDPGVCARVCTTGCLISMCN